MAKAHGSEKGKSIGKTSSRKRSSFIDTGYCSYYKQSFKLIIKDELIGRVIEVIDAQNLSLIGIKGTVIDETKNMLIVEVEQEDAQNNCSNDNSRNIRRNNNIKQAKKDIKDKMAGYKKAGKNPIKKLVKSQIIFTTIYKKAIIEVNGRAIQGRPEDRISHR